MKGISDEDLFAGIGRAPSAPVAVVPNSTAAASALANASAVLDELSSAMLQMPFGVNLDSAEQLWAIELAEYDLDDLLAAARNYARNSESRVFPTVGQIAAMAKVIRQDRAHVRAAKRTRGRCEACGGNYFVEDPPMSTEWRACPDCNPERRAWEDQGHAAKDHDQGACDHELCKGITKQRRRRRAS